MAYGRLTVKLMYSTNSRKKTRPENSISNSNLVMSQPCHKVPRDLPRGVPQMRARGQITLPFCAECVSHGQWTRAPPSLPASVRRSTGCMRIRSRMQKCGPRAKDVRRWAVRDGCALGGHTGWLENHTGCVTSCTHKQSRLASRRATTPHATNTPRVHGGAPDF